MLKVDHPHALPTRESGTQGIPSCLRWLQRALCIPSSLLFSPDLSCQTGLQWVEKTTFESLTRLATRLFKRIGIHVNEELLTTSSSQVWTEQSANTLQSQLLLTSTHKDRTDTVSSHYPNSHRSPPSFPLQNHSINKPRHPSTLSHPSLTLLPNRPKNPPTTK